MDQIVPENLTDVELDLNGYDQPMVLVRVMNIAPGQDESPAGYAVRMVREVQTEMIEQLTRAAVAARDVRGGM